MARTVAIIQARMTSTRFPGKVLAMFHGEPLVIRVWRRVRAAALVERVVVAVPYGVAQIPLHATLSMVGAYVAFPEVAENDLLARYASTAKNFGNGATEIVRVTADCPFVDPRIIDLAITLRREYDLPFLAMSAFRGSEVEVFTMDALLDADAHAVDPVDREHVGPYMRRKYAVNMCIDTPDDYARLTA